MVALGVGEIPIPEVDDVNQRYTAELARLAATYEAVLSSDLRAFSRLVAHIHGRPAIFVGSGGALGVAQLAADLHQLVTGQLAQALTPLSLLGAPRNTRVSVILYSAGARHPDAALAVNAAMRMGYDVSLVTCQEEQRISADVKQRGVQVVMVPSPKDGFLATNSVLALAAATCRAFGYELPLNLPWLTTPVTEVLRSECLLLFSPKLRPVALDLEARVAETGLSWAQYTDLRNFAHGRHVGLARRLEEVSVVPIISAGDRELAERTVGMLPAEADVVRLESELEYPSSVVDLLVSSMRILRPAAARAAMDPGRPGAPLFGRKLYHLSATPFLRLPDYDPVRRKLSALGLGLRYRESVARAFDRWCMAVRKARLRCLILDYDGTCCFTDERFDPPPSAVTERLCWLLEQGLVLAFASGRGRSLVETAREWIPEEHWPKIHLGLYNGTLRLRLSDPLEETYEGAEGELSKVVDRLGELEEMVELRIEARCTQISISASGMSGLALLPVIETLLARPPAIRCKIASSGHSVDVIPSDGSKANFIEDLTALTAGEVLAVGDQGHPGGNDFELLAATRWSLTVDTCSPDITRCWNLDADGARGPDLLAQYLGALHRHSDDDGFKLDWCTQ